MSELSQWGHCVWIFLSAHPISPHVTPLHRPSQGLLRVLPPAPPTPSFIWWKHAHSSRFTNNPSPQLTALTRDTFSVLLIFQQSTLSWICLCWRFWQKQGAGGCTATEGGPVQFVFFFSLIEKEQKATHKGAYCICMITGSRTLSENLQWRNPGEWLVMTLVRRWTKKKNHIRIIFDRCYLCDWDRCGIAIFIFFLTRKTLFRNQCNTKTCWLTSKEKDALARASLLLPSSAIWILCFLPFCDFDRVSLSCRPDDHRLINASHKKW